jgi:hypothetical protein
LISIKSFQFTSEDLKGKMKLILAVVFVSSLSLGSGSVVSGRNRQPCSISECSPGFILDSFNCTCNDDPNFIPEPSLLRFAPKNSLIAPRETSPCEPCPGDNFTLDPETCECSCDIQCPEKTNSISIVNITSCECDFEPCSVDCGPGFIIDWDSCENLCSGCLCMPEQSAGSETPSKFICELSQESCATGWIFDRNICDCVQEDPTPVCPRGFIYDQVNCICVCAEVSECLGRAQWSNSTCDCFCPSDVDDRCPEGSVFEYEACRCFCEKVLECPAGSYFDEDTCQCHCYERRQCDEGFIFDDDKCECVSAKDVFCFGGFVYDEEKCDCVCERDRTCPDSQVFDELICQCVELID